MFRRLLAALTVLLVLTAAGCSSETTDKAKETFDSAKDDAGDAVDDAKDGAQEKTEQAKARTAAETFRNTLKSKDPDADGSYRSIDLIEDAGADLPGDAELTGVEDSDGDGLDDDGDVQIDAGDESACVRIPETGDDIDVEGGAC